MYTMQTVNFVKLIFGVVFIKPCQQFPYFFPVYISTYAFGFRSKLSHAGIQYLLIRIFARLLDPLSTYQMDRVWERLEFQSFIRKDRNIYFEMAD